MSKLWARIRLALRRGLAKADSWVAAVAFWVGGMSAANDDWVWAVVVGVVGLVFLVSAGDFAWRKGFAAGKRGAG